METITHTVPTTLLKEKDLVIAKCNLLIEAFNSLCKDENIRIQEEIKIKRESRRYKYSIAEIDNGWKVLYKEITPETKYDEEDCKPSWSKPFKIINGVLFHRENYYNNRANVVADKIIPQGLFDESTIESVNKDW